MPHRHPRLNLGWGDATALRTSSSVTPKSTSSNTVLAAIAIERLTADVSSSFCSISNAANERRVGRLLAVLAARINQILLLCSCSRAAIHRRASPIRSTQGVCPAWALASGPIDSLGGDSRAQTSSGVRSGTGRECQTNRQSGLVVTALRACQHQCPEVPGAVSLGRGPRQISRLPAQKTCGRVRGIPKSSIARFALLKRMSPIWCSWVNWFCRRVKASPIQCGSKNLFRILISRSK